MSHCFSRVSEGTLGSFWGRFWRCSVLQGHCVSPSGRVRFQSREEELQQQRVFSGGRAAAATGVSEGTLGSRRVLYLIVQTVV